jgi:hypothetical protein
MMPAEPYRGVFPVAPTTFADPGDLDAGARALRWGK